jgi:hypothetical protein
VVSANNMVATPPCSIVALRDDNLPPGASTSTSSGEFTPMNASGLTI